MTRTSVPLASLAPFPSYVALLGNSFVSLGNAFKNYYKNSSDVCLCDFFASDKHKFSGKSQHL